MTYREYVKTRSEQFKISIDKIIDFVKAVNDWDFFTFTQKVNVTQVDNVAAFDKMLKHYIDGYPLAYIAKYTYFYDLKIATRDGVFIPRKETELLVDTVIQTINRKAKNHELYKILEIGTGTGAISIALAKQFPNADVTAVDISSVALELANENATAHNVDVNFVKSDLFSEVDKNGKKFELIVSNPPYIAFNDKNVDTMVKQYEPRQALYATNNGLDIIERIIKDCHKYLTQTGICALEFGWTQVKLVRAIIEKYYPQAKAKHFFDYDNNARYIIFSPNKHLESNI